MKLRLRHGVRADIVSATLWYGDLDPRLARSFIAEIDACFERIAQYPLRYARISGEVRRALCRRFPYSVYFVLEHETVSVVAVLHHRQSRELLSTRS